MPRNQPKSHKPVLIVPMEPSNIQLLFEDTRYKLSLAKPIADTLDRPASNTLTYREQNFIFSSISTLFF